MQHSWFTMLCLFLLYSKESSHVQIRELDHKKGRVLKNWCLWTVVLEKTLESPLDCKETKPVNPKGNQPRIFIERLMLKLKLQYLATWCEELTYWKRPWCWARLKAGGEGDDRDGWMASLTQWTWVWVNSIYWRWTGRSGALQSMGVEKSQILINNFSSFLSMGMWKILHSWIFSW